MMNEPTLDKLKQLRLDGMADAWLEQNKNAKIGALGFDERFGLLVDAETLHRENRRLRRLQREAKLKIASACVEDVDFPTQRNLDKAAFRQLANCRWVQQSHTVAITGAAGTGKTYLACALANQACRKGFSAMYRRAPRFFDELALARALACSSVLPASTSWSSTTGAWRRSARPSAATCSRSSMTGTAAAPPC